MEASLLVVTNNIQDLVAGLVDVFEFEEVGDGDIVDGLAFAIAVM